MGRGAPIHPSRVNAAGEAASNAPAVLAAAAGLAPALRQSGRSRTPRRARRGDKDPKRILHQSAFRAFSIHPDSRTCYDRKRREGKHHVQAVIALARQRTNAPWTMLTYNKPCDPNHRAA